ncbi:MAG: hypothetical protein PF795_08705, partial [Kiritimatiellae bacterium]|nr:hypothetical protein [Kiritimatiellia bacterium]
MPQTLSKALYNRLIRSRNLREVLENLHVMSGMDALFLDGLGNERVAFPRVAGMRLRRMIHRDPDSRTWFASRRLAVLVGEEPQTGIGFREVMHPLKVEGEKVGYLVLSAARNTKETGP